METVVRELEDTPIEHLAQLKKKKKEYTFEELAELNATAWNNDGVTYELSEGELVPVCPSAVQQSDLVLILGENLRHFTKDHPIGKVGVDLGYIFQRQPRRTVFAPDLSFVRQERIPPEGRPKKGYWEIIPDLAIEVVSPDDVLYTVFEKVITYLQFGVKEVWLIIPPVQTVIIYHSRTDVRYLVTSDKLESPEILPGFSIPIAELFETD